ncbi:hypothetical protein [Sulfurimonas sp. C5]|uniref:hypothetical protein n=1 Tax=Sulfurimonas sp. C5 TaxID=3036947 RepID=UPI0024566350|nr:hypothetical protein [Sulfurimonas sp. C5]MDH4944243.1 hypothetical protein [Sulfurimonas sp. C5]
MKILLSVMIVCLLFFSMAIEIDAQALELQNEAFQRAMIAFGIAKSLNAVISLIQGTELSLTPAGLGITLSVGEILDPLNDMVERFSWVMLLATISLGIQKFLLILSGKTLLQVLLSLSGIIALAMIWYRKLHHNLFFSYSLKVFALLVLLRFGAIAFVGISQITYTAILQNEYEQSLQVVEETKTNLEEFQQARNIDVQQQQGSFFSELKKRYDKSIESLNISQQIASLAKSTNQAFNNIVVLITIFVLQSIILPLVYIWLVVHGIKYVFRSELKFDTFKNMYNERY